MDNSTLISDAEQHVAPTYGRYPIALVRGEGCRVWDADGKEYLDFVSGLAVCNLGHCHPGVVAAIREQAGKLIHVSNLYHIEPQIELAKRLNRLSFGDKAFFCNSGTEAVEAALKLARKYSYKKYGEGRHEILSFDMSFHGRTMASLSATGQTKFHGAFKPLLPGFRYVPFGDVESVAAAVSEQTCAIMVEPIQGEGGVNVPPEGYLKGLREICDANDLLLLFDEVQVGLGRTGKLWAYEHEGVAPDAMCLAKALAGGTAIGALVASDKAMAFEPGDHAATFGGNPLATAAGCAADGRHHRARIPRTRAGDGGIRHRRTRGFGDAPRHYQGHQGQGADHRLRGGRGRNLHRHEGARSGLFAQRGRPEGYSAHPSPGRGKRYDRQADEFSG